MNEQGKVVVLVAHPKLNESKANKELLDTVKEMDGVIVYDLYEKHKEEFDVDAWSRFLSDASALIFQFPLQWMSAPFMMKRWQDEVLTFLSKTPSIAGKPFMVVTTAGSDYESYRTGGKNRFTIDEILRPYQVMALVAGMQWQTPIVVYGVEEETAGKRISMAASEYRERITSFISQGRQFIAEGWF
ncbi:NAD(P)H-dependent oxidoreductase [Bacteroides sp. 224]|uniref:NAD(P)H-dependent oxidoreductase n=1 Tax=Bacteroides sp. 224 TaxID=2302936 RepID=UPI0013CF9E09|nr:NAD(P)H-dependent oxidoreductase [Bacteroides sp. 224]NDV66975.1 flavodoxin family protein [Bacteroides sp. 224]